MKTIFFDTPDLMKRAREVLSLFGVFYIEWSDRLLLVRERDLQYALELIKA